MATEISKEIKKYIGVEKDISRYRIKTLEKSKDISASKRRILEIEREFISLPLERWNFEDLSDVAAAISIYRSSRNLFYKTYGMNKPKKLNRAQLIDILNCKIEFVQNSAIDFTGHKVDEVNLVQDEDIFYELAQTLVKRGRKALPDQVEDLKGLSLDELIEIEPIVISKDRARRQAILYSIGLYLTEEISKIKVVSKSEDSIRNLIEAVDDIVVGLEKSIFKYYNLSLETLPFEIERGMGRNDSFRKVHRLKNVLDFDNLVRDIIEFPRLFKRDDFSFDCPVIGNLTPESKTIIGGGFSKEKRRASKSKAVGILLPIPRIGNERMSLMYAHVCVRGVKLDSLLDRGISNFKIVCNDEPEYFKALMMKPLWAILDSSYNKSIYGAVLSNLIGHDFEHVEEFDREDVVEKLNSTIGPLIPLDNDSIILVPKTRSEEDAFAKIKPWWDDITKRLKTGYFSTTNDSILD